MGNWNWLEMLETSAEVWESWEPDIIRTDAGMAFLALDANLSRFLAEGCLFNEEEERVPFCCWSLDLFFGLLFGDFLDD